MILTCIKGGHAGDGTIRDSRAAIRTRVSGGWVTLSGEVGWHHQRTAAEAAVRELSGVVGGSGPIGLAAKIQPADVGLRIAGVLARQARREADRIGITVEGATVTLTGAVDSGNGMSDAWAAGRLAVSCTTRSPPPGSR